MGLFVRNKLIFKCFYLIPIHNIELIFKKINFYFSGDDKRLLLSKAV